MYNLFKGISILFFFCLLLISAKAGDLHKCTDHLRNELRNTLEIDNGLINAQLNLTSLKLAKKVLARKGLASQTIEAYTQSIIGPITKKRLENPQLQNQILEIYNKYGDEQYHDMQLELQDLVSDKTKLNDAQVARLMILLEKSDGSFGFNENDFATAWLMQKLAQAGDNKASFHISDGIANILAGIDQDPSKFKQQQELIAYNIAQNEKEMKKDFIKLKHKVFSKYRADCLNLYSKDNLDTQNESIFAHCRVDDNAILDSEFTLALEDILKNLTDIDQKIGLNIQAQPNSELDDLQVRKWQDVINQQATNRERIVQYHQSPLNPDTRCQTFALVDKVNQSISVYHNDGEEILAAKSIIGDGVRGDGIKLNPDSLLRAWNNIDQNGDVIINPKTKKPQRKYSHTTGAGIYYTVKDLTKDERIDRLYDQEFKDRILPVSLKVLDESGKNYVYDEKIQAIHGVPNSDWIGNYQQRMQSFSDDKATRKLSFGCVNLEGYTYDLVNELLEHQCPIYILPEDPANYFFVKNRQLNFSTADISKKLELEKIVINDQGDEIENKYAYTPKNLEQFTKGYLLSNGEKSKSLDFLLQPEIKAELFERANLLENDTFEDFAKIAALQTEDTHLAKAIFLNLYNAYYRLSVNDRVNLDFIPHQERVKLILNKYKEDFDPNLEADHIYQRMQNIHFRH